MKIKEIKTKNLIWTDIEKPSRKKLTELKHKYGFHSLDIEDVLTYTQRPKIEKYDNYYFLILRFPVFDKKSKKFKIIEFDIFSGKNFFISIHQDNIDPIIKFIKSCSINNDIKNNSCQDPGMILYHILKDLFLYCFPIIDHINDDIDNIDENIFQHKEKEMLEEILLVKRNIITLRRVIGPHRKIIALLNKKGVSPFSKNLNIYYDDLTDYIERIWDILENQRETIFSLEHTNETIISHKSSEIIKILTIFSALLLPLALIANIYGMNVAGIPFLDHPDSFLIIVSIMAISSLVFILYFIRNKWL